MMKRLKSSTEGLTGSLLKQIKIKIVPDTGAPKFGSPYFFAPTPPPPPATPWGGVPF